MINAGVCGLISFLEYNNADKDDYKISGQTLYISKEYLKNNNDMGIKYIDTMAEIFEETSSYKRELYKIDNAVKILETKDMNDLEETEKKNCLEQLNKFADRMVMSSKVNMYNSLKEYSDVIPFNRDLFDKLKENKDLAEKYEIYKEVKKHIEQPRVHKLLIYTELIYGKFKLFFNENAQSKKITCLCETGKAYFKTYDKNFYAPLIAEIDEEEKKKTSRCIECMGNMKNKKDFTFLVDSTDDVNRKKSYYWNCIPDAYVCPLCAFVYTFIPLGFKFFGGDALFINSNSSIAYLRSKNSKQGGNEDNILKRRILRTLTDEKITGMEYVKSNVQVILRSNDYSHFRFDIIDVETIEHLQNGKKYFTSLEKIKINFGIDTKPNWLYVYDMVFDCITLHQSFYGIADKIIKHEIDEYCNYVINIIYLENIFYGGDEMEELNKKVNNAWEVGKKLRESILGENAFNSGAEDDNKLRGTIYRLINLTAVGDRAQFMDTVLRIYTGYNLTIPPVFKECYQSEETFKAISHGFILGLKYVKYEKENTNE